MTFFLRRRAIAAGCAIATISIAAFAVEQALASALVPSAQTLSAASLPSGQRAVYQFDGHPVTGNPYVSGEMYPFTWTQLEPSEGAYNWSLIDQAAATWSGRHIAIRPYTFRPKSGDNGTPAWVFADGARSVVSAQGYTAPVFWDATFQAKLTTFVQALAARYDGQIAWVQAGLGYWGEAKIDTSKSGVDAQWLAAGYTDQLWLATLQRIAGIYTSAFTHTRVVVESGENFLQSSISNSAWEDWATQHGVGLQRDDLTASGPVASKLGCCAGSAPLHIEEQQSPTSATGDTLQQDLTWAAALGAQVALVASSDLGSNNDAAIQAFVGSSVTPPTPTPTTEPTSTPTTSPTPTPTPTTSSTATPTPVPTPTPSPDGTLTFASCVGMHAATTFAVHAGANGEIEGTLSWPGGVYLDLMVRDGTHQLFGTHGTVSPKNFSKRGLVPGAGYTVKIYDASDAPTTFTLTVGS